ncbi:MULTISPECIES: beta-N-acetylhexosaminidase [unclassified Duganella]|uniref:beta-N-acetylhexosaminidase n=1 Tax=unclassified Duganella TaxID=2636909 RepID=UPI0008819667|nr:MULTISPECIES: beta-N-acetylhexosaminidase [unclassified Duganella]SDH30939.1 beta-N-acetylhexosaminidase [Duganella sp. OV458]SDK47848.1 beta-N-acetylhexosaminidase [Duganella sp. OV510]
MQNDDLRKIAGQLIMIRFPGTVLDEATAAHLKANGIRAVCLFRGNMTDSEQLAKLTADLRAVMGPDALIAIDQEGGAVVRSTWVPAPPAAMGLGAANDTDLAWRTGAAVARAVKSLGFNWNFAPVLDLNNNPHNPVIAERSFGAEPQRAAELAMAWMAGSHAEGVACCVKHFPGHGDTNVDSHRDLPTVNKPVEELDRLELAPFRIASAAAPAMMTAHIVYPTLDAENPATMSRRILHDLLREEWQYQGIIITDGMDMHAIAGRYGVGNAAVRALTAGADMVMALGTTETQNETLNAIAAAIASGELSQADIDTRLARLSALARAYPCKPRSYKEDAADREIMAEGWRRSLTAYSIDGKAPHRPAAGAKVRLIARQDVVSDGVSEAGVPAAVVAESLRQLYDVELLTFADADSFDWSALPQDGRYTMLASTSRLRYGEHARATWRPDLHLALWNPYQALDIQAPALLTYGFARPALDAINGWLSGELQASGKAPVPGFEQ